MEQVSDCLFTRGSLTFETCVSLAATCRSFNQAFSNWRDLIALNHPILLNVPREDSQKIDIKAQEVLVHTMITPEQQQVLDSVFQRNNTFMYGAGGVGKSFCIHQITKWCNENEHKVGITATTGSAAFLIGGTTIHSFLGIGVPDKKPPFLVADHVKKKRKDIVKKLAKLDILVIDEISMMSSNLFDFISVYLSIVRECDMPFGGVQIVLSGDVYQLPPCDGEFVFKAEVWNDANFSSYELIK